MSDREKQLAALRQAVQIVEERRDAATIVDIDFGGMRLHLEVFAEEHS